MEEELAFATQAIRLSKLALSGDNDLANQQKQVSSNATRCDNSMEMEIILVPTG